LFVRSAQTYCTDEAGEVEPMAWQDLLEGLSTTATYLSTQNRKIKNNESEEGKQTYHDKCGK
jgi:hypothetical protein